MLLLPNGCKCSCPSVSPKNWKTNKSSIQKQWSLIYWFYDPLQPKPKQVRLRGMNTLSEWKARRELTETMLQQLDEALRSGYNPFLKNMVRPTTFEIEPETPFIEALHLVLDRITAEKKTKKDIRNTLRPIKRAAMQLHYETLPIAHVRKKHIRTVLDKCYGNSPRFTNNTFNHYRKYLGILFENLSEMEVVDSNPALAVHIRPTVKKIRKTLTKEQRREVNAFLFQRHYRFWRFLQIFFHSGGRITELMKLKKEDVNLQEQYYKTIVLKRKIRSEELRTINDMSLPFWEEVMKEAMAGEYLFSKSLQPGKEMIRPDQITKRWYRLVKKKKGWNIEADFYSLKHSHTSEVVKLRGEQTAAKRNGHTSTAMIKSIYDVERKDREHEELKSIGVAFA